MYGSGKDHMKEISRKIYDSVSPPFKAFLISFGVTGNQVTIFNHIFTLTFLCYFFTQGTHSGYIMALFFGAINMFLDYLDGDIAKETKSSSSFGVWLDSGFDVIFQNFVMGAIAYGCYIQGLSVGWILFFFMGNAANNFVSFHYNQKFGFDSDKGNELFRKLMNRKCHIANKILKDVIDPTGNYFSLAFYTYRYWVLLGALLFIMPICFQIMTVINNVKWVLMYLVYSFYLKGEDRPFLFKVLSALDDEREDYYALRSS